MNSEFSNPINNKFYKYKVDLSLKLFEPTYFLIRFQIISQQFHRMSHLGQFLSLRESFS